MKRKLTDKQKKILVCAKKHQVKVTVIDEAAGVLELKKGNKKRYLSGFALSFNSKPGVALCKDKHVTKLILNSAGINCPRGIRIGIKDDAVQALKKAKIKFPVAVKPIDGAKGVGVVVNVKDALGVNAALKEIRKIAQKQKSSFSGEAVIEEMFTGHDYRLLVLKGRVIACCQRIPALVIGDGKRTIAQIIKDFNAARPEAFQLIVDAEVRARLKESKVSLKTVLIAGRAIQLRQVANISEGGVSLNLTGTVSQRFKQIAIKAVNELELVLGGVDLLANDISSNNPKQPYTILEVNGAPQYEINERPLAQGPVTDVTDIIFRNYMGI